MRLHARSQWQVDDWKKKNELNWRPPRGDPASVSLKMETGSLYEMSSFIVRNYGGNPMHDIGNRHVWGERIRFRNRLGFECLRRYLQNDPSWVYSPGRVIDDRTRRRQAVYRKGKASIVLERDTALVRYDKR